MTSSKSVFRVTEDEFIDLYARAHYGVYALGRGEGRYEMVCPHCGETITEYQVIGSLGRFWCVNCEWFSEITSWGGHADDDPGDGAWLDPIGSKYAKLSFS